MRRTAVALTLVSTYGAVACITTSRNLALQDGDRDAAIVPIRGYELVRGAGGASFADDTHLLIIDVFVAGGAARSMLATIAGDSIRSTAPLLDGFSAWHAGAQVLPGGRALIFESPHRPIADSTREDTDLWMAERAGAGWRALRPLGPPFDSPFNEHNPTVSARGLLCINSNRETITRGHDILCAARVADGWQAPVVLGAEVNSAAREIAPFIDPDERYLLFASNRPGGAGDYDLYVSRGSRRGWSPAEPLGGGVNTSSSESNPAVSPDGRTLLFTRSVAGGARLYRVSLAAALPR